MSKILGVSFAPERGVRASAWGRQPSIYQLAFSRSARTGPWSVHVQTIDGHGVHQGSQEVGTWHEAVTYLLEQRSIDATELLPALRQAITYALDDQEEAAEAGWMDDARLWHAEQWITEQVESNPTWLHEHGGDPTTAAAGYLNRFGDGITTELLPPAAHPMSHRVLGAYRLTCTEDLVPWTVELDLAVDGAGEVFGRVREGSFTRCHT